MPNIYTYQKVVTTSGTPVQLADQSVEQDQIVLLKAKSSNTGVITVGNSSANALNSGNSFFRLFPGQSIEIEVANTKQLWIDAAVSGEGVEYFIGVSGGQMGSNDTNGNLKTTEATLHAGEDLSVSPYGVQIVEQRFNYAYITTATTTVVKSGAGFLHTIVVGSGATSLVIYDNTAGSGTKIFEAAGFGANEHVTLQFDIAFSTGLTIVTDATGRINVSYR